MQNDVFVIGFFLLVYLDGFSGLFPEEEAFSQGFIMGSYAIKITNRLCKVTF